MFKIIKFDFKDKNKQQILLICSILTILNILVIKIWNLENFTFRLISFKFSIIFSITFIILYTIICFILRLKRKKNILKGIFYYQMIGAISFIILFIGLLAGHEIKFFSYIFAWWSMPLEPVSIILSLNGFLPFRFIRAIVYLVYALISGNSYIQINKDIAFENKIAERKAMEQESIRRHG